MKQPSVKKKQRPVFVFIHGGNFVRGSAGDYEPDYMLDEDIGKAIF